MLYTATGLDILVTATLAAWVIPYVLNDPAPVVSPEMAATASWAIMAIHLIILAVLIRKIWVSRRGGRLRKAGLIVPGIILVLMSMVLTDAAGIYLEYKPVVFSMAIILFISAFFDLMTGIILIMLPIRLQGRKQD
jgi:hypothetical protein